MNRQPKHWVLVADSGQARILELQRKPYEFRQVSELASASQHQTTRELVSDASGRSFHVQGPGSHVKLPRSDPKDQAEEAFVESLAGTLDKAVRLGAFDDLVLIADPKTMGRLRRDISREVAARVTQEHTLDLVGMPLNALEPRVRAVLGWKH
jgi:protein required for attachment to host cells